ncbi:MAG TPA: malto-oligosyltrehalose trehalohydrolase [Chthoniobacterales bacterium]
MDGKRGQGTLESSDQEESMMEQTRRFSQGAEWTGTGVSYRTWAVDKKTVAVVIVDETGKVVRQLPLKPDGSGFYAAWDSWGKPGDLYQYEVDGQCLPDPASRFQPQGVHGPSQVIDPAVYAWQAREWRRPDLRDLVIYELHVGTFTPEGTYAAISQHFDHLKQVGVNAIQLMPVADFPGRWNWGYDAVACYAPSRAYGTPDELRGLVDAAHGAGLAVILDVVYNHLGPDGNYLGAYAKDYFNPQHTTPWGAAFNFDAPHAEAVRQFFVENPQYWLTDFHVDGFRLDATHAIPDDSPKHVIQEIAEHVQAAGALVICEDPRNDRKIILPRESGGYGCDAVWADDFHHVVRVQMTQENEGYLGYFKGTIDEIVRTINEGWLFVGQKQIDGLPRGTRGSDLPPERFVFCISNHDQVGNRAFGDRISKVVDPAAYRAASGLFLLTPYTPMLFMGQEWAASTPFLYFTDHETELGRNITQGRRKEFSQFKAFSDPVTREQIPDPQADATFQDSKLNWTEPAEGGHATVVRLYTALLQLRTRWLGSRQRGDWHAEPIGEAALALRYDLPAGQAVLVVAQLTPVTSRLNSGAHPVLRAGNNRTWELLLSTNEVAYGGKRTGHWDPSTKEFVLTEPEVMVFLER